MNGARTIVGAVLAMSVSAQAQWLNYPTAGVPRLPDGKPNLSAPAPRTADGKPDLSGIWQLQAECPPGGCPDYAAAPEFRDLGARLNGGLPYQPWAAALVKEMTRSGCVVPRAPCATSRFRRPESSFSSPASS